MSDKATKRQSSERQEKVMSKQIHKWDAVYAHCTKATPGKLDREPWYQYEQRLVMLTAEPVLLDYEEPPRQGIQVTAPNGTRAIEETIQDAVQSVLYKLMAASRSAAEQQQAYAS